MLKEKSNIVIILGATYDVRSVGSVNKLLRMFQITEILPNEGKTGWVVELEDKLALMGLAIRSIDRYHSSFSSDRGPLGHKVVIGKVVGTQEVNTTYDEPGGVIFKELESIPLSILLPESARVGAILDRPEIELGIYVINEN